LKLLRARKGIMRVIEALFASIIILVAIVASNQLIVFPNPFTSRTRSDLEKLGYNLMFKLAQDKAFERLILDDDNGVRSGWENDAKIFLSGLIPIGVYFNLTVYEVLDNGEASPINSQPITNAETEEVFLKGGDVVTVIYMYTMKIEDETATLLFYLVLTRGGR
jgi:hypothetical protein